ncbi:hypothetical protein FDF74_11495 [Clostridium niameyense]|uniref:Uncharacterized protein n=1 Tax=Clostridium niameyense TaxID=1622073 RepID=A0A6M0RBY4_9CLOT|nr:hypothetical protein [Clostridium niameyense]NEZ47805.1 hypothetical protein [Clostridium niameyense]
MDFNNVNQKWLNKWNSKTITKDAFITRHVMADICIKDVGIQPSCCTKKLDIGTNCEDCWYYVYLAMWKRHMFK